MIYLTGKYCDSIIYTDVVDDESISQVLSLLNQPYTKECKIRMMPDIHAGAGCTIGTTMTIKDKICPNLVGVDIGCGVMVTKIKEKEIDFRKLDNTIREKIPSGFSTRENQYTNVMDSKLERLKCVHNVDIERAKKSLGTLGGGNHFIEIDKDSNNNLYIVVHTGSRHLGVDVAKYYQNIAYTNNNKHDKEIENLIHTMKRFGLDRDIEREITKFKTEHPKIQKDLAYIEGNNFADYIHDMKIAQEYATLNREIISNIIVESMGLAVEEQFTSVHNYIDTDNMVMRKGAVAAYYGQKLIIPINMRDGSLICIGRGNEDWNCSAPHGAGRLMSRSKAKEMVSLKEFQDSMKGIFTTSVCESTIDESPMVYKSIDDIVNNIRDTAKLISIIKPVYNFKAN